MAWGGYLLDKAGTVLVKARGFADFEQRLLVHKHQHFQDQPFPYIGQRHQKWRILQLFPNGGKLSAQFPPEEGKVDFPAVDATGATIYLHHTWGPDLVRAYIDDPQPNHTAYVYTFVYSPRPQTVGAWIDFHNYGRSGKDASPLNGQWDYKGSRIWINDKPVHPPTWATPGQHPASLEIPYTNEPYENRSPVAVTLRKGWNEVLLKLPVGAFQTADYRLVKWMFTCVFVRPTGINYEVATDLIVSPDRHLPTH